MRNSVGKADRKKAKKGKMSRKKATRTKRKNKYVERFLKEHVRKACNDGKGEGERA
jgi:hypothetical protein